MVGAVVPVGVELAAPADLVPEVGVAAALLLLETAKVKLADSNVPQLLFSSARHLARADATPAWFALHCLKVSSQMKVGMVPL